MLSVILAVLLAAPLLPASSLIGAAPPLVETRARQPKPPPTPESGKPPTSPIATTSRHGTERTRSARPATPRKQQDNTVTPNRGTVDPIGRVSRGQSIDISGTALRSGQTCLFRLFYADKPGPVIRDIVPDEKKRCTASVTIPDRPSAVGGATAVLIFTRATSGKRDGSARQTFTVT